MKNIKDFINTIYLASQSIGRKQILEDAGLKVIVCPTGCNEDGNWQNAEEMVTELAKRKLHAFLESGKYTDRTIPALASDTTVLVNGKTMGKAYNREDAKKQLLELSGTTHTVYSSYALCINGKFFYGCDKTEVTFKNIEDKIEEILNTGDWEGSAGSYRIAPENDMCVKCIKGDINTVIGLPLFAISEIIESLYR